MFFVVRLNLFILCPFRAGKLDVFNGGHLDHVEECCFCVNFVQLFVVSFGLTFGTAYFAVKLDRALFSSEAKH